MSHPVTRSPLLLLWSLLLIALTIGCSGKGGARQPASPDSPQESSISEAGADSWDTTVLGFLSGVIHPDGTVTLDELTRQGLAIGDTFDLDATEFFTQWPCRDCLQMGGISRDGFGNIRLPFTARHPFQLGQNGRYDLHIFDVRGILILRGNTLFPGIGTVPINNSNTAFTEQVLQGDPQLVLNADGYTTYFDWQAANPDYGSPRNIPGNLNPFKRFFTDPDNSPFDPLTPIGWNVMPMGSAEETQEFILSSSRLSALGSVPFAFVLDACYGQSAIRTTRGNPQYFLPEFSRKEAWDVQVRVLSNNLQAGDRTSRAVIEVSAKDWQELSSVNGAFPTNNLGNSVRFQSRIKEVRATIPGVSIADVRTSTPSGGGGSNANPWRFTLTLRNELQNLSQGPVYGLVAVRDDLYNVATEGPQRIPAPATPGGTPKEGMNIKDYTAYQYFETAIGPPVDDPPIADLSLTQPRIVLTGTTITLNGALSEDDIGGTGGIVMWEFDPEGTGTWIDNSAAIPPWEYAHVYTTPPNTQTIYNAALRVWDSGGQSATTSIQISVTTTPDAPPVAVLTPPANPWEIFTGDSTTINGSLSTDDFGIIKYEMNPGDGTGWVDNGLNPILNHTYNAPGVTTVYTVQLRVTDTALQTHTVSRNLTVIVIDDPPVANLIASPNNGNAPLLVNFDASGSTDDNAVIEYRMDFGDGGGFGAWQASPFFTYTYIPFLDQNFTATVQVRDASLQVDSATANISVTVPGGCLITGVTGPVSLNVGESANYSVVGAGLVTYQWTETSPNIQFVGPTNGPTVTVLALTNSAVLGGTQFTISGNGGTCSINQDITVFDLVVTGPAHSRQYVNRAENGNDTDSIGTRVTVNAAVVPGLAGINVTYNFQDPDEPSYQYIDDLGIHSLETDVLDNDNRGDARRPDGTANPLDPTSTKYQNGYEELPGPVYVSQTIRSTNGIGTTSAVYATSRFGGDNYQFAASADPAGNGFQISRTAAGTLTVWRWYGVPVYSMWDVGLTNALFYLPDYSMVNAQFGPTYIEWNFSSPTAPSAPTPQGYGGMAYLDPLDATAAAQIGYVDTVANYGAPAEAYTVGNGNKVRPNIFCFGLNTYNPAGVIGLNTVSFNPLLVPPPNQLITNKPYSTTDYVGVARGRMNALAFSVANQNKVLTHELGHALGVRHSDTGSAGSSPDTVKYGAAGVGIMRPAVNTTEAALWTASEIDLMRGIDRDVVNNNIMRGPYYEGG
ncbi:MAG: hypothetical protein GEEBNDBF_01072 [bacterium]|nr:hypothetical protein [bacterium]